MKSAKSGRALVITVAVASALGGALCVSQPEALAEAYVMALGGNGEDSLTSVIAYDETTYISAGYTTSWGTGGDILLTKFDFRGNVLWTKRVGGSGSDRPYCVIKTYDGNIAVTGWTTSSGEGGRDVFLAKFTPNGNLLWAKTLGANGNDEGFCVIETYDNDLVVVGDTDSVAASGWDVLLAKFDGNNGNRRWVKRAWSAGRSDWGYRLVEMPNQDLLVAGGTASGVGEFEDRDILVVRFDSGGGLIWGWWIGQSVPRWEWAHSLIRTSDNGYALAGWQTHREIGPCSSFLIKLDSALDYEWKRIVPSQDPFNNYARSVIQTSDDDLVVAGGYFSPATSSLDVWLAKANVDSGVFRWSSSFGERGADEASDVIENGCGCLVAVGYTVSYGDHPPNALLARCTWNGKTCLEDRPGPGSQTWNPPDGVALLEEDTLDWQPRPWSPTPRPVDPDIITVCAVCPGDIDCDGHTAHSDLGILLSAWCSHPGDLNWNPCADLDGDDHVGHGDLGILLSDWGCSVDP